MKHQAVCGSMGCVWFRPVTSQPENQMANGVIDHHFFGQRSPVVIAVPGSTLGHGLGHSLQSKGRNQVIGFSDCPSLGPAGVSLKALVIRLTKAGTSSIRMVTSHPVRFFLWHTTAVMPPA